MGLDDTLCLRFKQLPLRGANYLFVPLYPGRQPWARSSCPFASITETVTPYNTPYKTPQKPPYNSLPLLNPLNIINLKI